MQGFSITQPDDSVTDIPIALIVHQMISIVISMILVEQNELG
jgi:hypothetical protein